MSQARPGALIAIIVFSVFAAYAFLTPAVYRTSALVVVESADPSNLVAMPQPLEAARRLGEAVLDRKTLERLSRERAASGDADAQAQASSQVRRGLEIDTSDGHNFSISYRDSDPSRAQNACNELSRHAVEVAPQVLADRAPERALELRRQQQTQELAAFLALHPQVAAEAPPAGQAPDKDPALSAFRAEKANLERRIAAIESGSISDNPYVDPRESDPKQLKRRLAEIDAAVNARRQAFDAKPSGVVLSADLRAEWKRLLAAVTDSSSEHAVTPPATLVARIATPAVKPSSPIEPNRRLLLFFGVVFGVGLGSAFTLAVRAAQQRRSSKSSRPPAKPSAEAELPLPSPSAVPGLGFTAPLLPSSSRAPALGSTAPLLASASPVLGSTARLLVPAAPQLPSGLGPAVPLSQPQPSHAPPIVPMPQRQISSSPPDAARSGRTGNGASSHPPAVERASSDQRSDPGQQTSSRPPARRFASTLVLPPAANPVTELEPEVPLASAAKAWDQQIRAHDVPGFAVVEAASEGAASEASAELPVLEPVSVSATPLSQDDSFARPAAAPSSRAASRAHNPMKVTQPLGSFLPDAVWLDPSKNSTRSEAGRASEPARTAAQRRSPSPPAPDSQYSYVSTPPPSPEPAAAPSEPRRNVIRVQEVPSDWHPDPSLTPAAQRGLCEQLYPYAVENCFVLAVVSVPEAMGYKSRVAAELSLALAESGHPRILLLEGDLHRPWVQRLIGVEMPIANGFSQQLSARTRGSTDERWSVFGCTKSLHVLAEGMMRSPGLLLSKQFADCVRELRSYYDFIVIDGPTTSLDVEFGALDAVSDGLITVCPAKGSPALSNMQSMFSQKRFSAFATSP